MICILGVNADADVDSLKGFIHRKHIGENLMPFIKLNCLQSQCWAFTLHTSVCAFLPFVPAWTCFYLPVPFVPVHTFRAYLQPLYLHATFTTRLIFVRQSKQGVATLCFNRNYTLPWLLWSILCGQTPGISCGLEYGYPVFTCNVIVLCGRLISAYLPVTRGSTTTTVSIDHEDFVVGVVSLAPGFSVSMNFRDLCSETGREFYRKVKDEDLPLRVSQ